MNSLILCDEAVSHDAQAINVASTSLLDAARSVHTVDDGLALYHIAKGLRERLDTVCAVALTRANEISSAKE